MITYLGRSELEDNPTATHCLQNCRLYGTDHITDKTRFRDPPMFHLTTPRVPDIDESGTTMPAVWLPGSTELGPFWIIIKNILHNFHTLSFNYIITNYFYVKKETVPGKVPANSAASSL